jgi:hemerythrin superfamily protein
MEHSETSTDPIELLRADHREVARLFHQFESAGNADSARVAAEEIVRAMSIHAAIEEQVLYPDIARTLPGGETLADHSLDEHEAVEELLASVDGLDPMDRDVRMTFRRLEAMVQRHVAGEEGTIFPAMRSKVPPERLRQMGLAIAGAKRIAPTRPHPASPDKPPANVIIGMAASVIDRVRDAAREAMR